MAVIHQMYKELEKCVEVLERDVKNSLNDLQTKEVTEAIVSLEGSKDYHYKEILNQLVEIKGHVKIISEHTKSIELLQNRIKVNRIDKDYIKRQVEAYQKMGMVNKRENKPTRPRETSSVRLLECWDRMMQEQGNQGIEGVLSVPKRTDGLRKNRKVVSSTFETFLEPSTKRSMSLDLLVEDKTYEPNDVKFCKSCDNLETNVIEEKEEVETNDDCGRSKSLPNMIDDFETGPRSSNYCKSVEAINEELTRSRLGGSSKVKKEDTKPRVVDVIYKKNINGLS